MKKRGAPNLRRLLVVQLLLMTALLIADDLWDATSGDQPASAA